MDYAAIYDPLAMGLCPKWPLEYFYCCALRDNFLLAELEPFGAGGRTLPPP